MPSDVHHQPLTSQDEPATDWLNQKELARLLGISTKTASVHARQGKLRVYEHGVPACGRRKYSRALVERVKALGWQSAIRRQDETAFGFVGDKGENPEWRGS